MALKRLLLRRGCTGRSQVLAAGHAARAFAAGGARSEAGSAGLQPVSCLGATLVAFAGAASLTLPASCEAGAGEEEISGAALVEDMIKLRGVVSMLQATTGVDEQQFLDAAKSAYMSAVGPDGRLQLERLEEVLTAMRQQQQGRRWPWQAVVSTVAISELAPVLFRLLDQNGDGNVTQREFMLGQALIYAAAKVSRDCAQGPAELSEICWRALDCDGNGVLDYPELKTAVKLMVAVGSVKPRDLHEKFAQIKRNHGPPMPIHRVRTVDELTQYYLDMYDSDGNGKISWEEFCRHSALKENFWRLLTSPEFEPFFLAESGLR